MSSLPVSVATWSFSGKFLAATSCASVMNPQTVVYQLGSFRLDPRNGLFGSDGAEVHLTPKALDTLALLVKRAGQVVTRNELLDAIWPSTYVSPSTVDSVIADLRQALGDSPKKPTYIRTHPKRGYMLIAPISACDRSADVPAPPLATPSHVGTLLDEKTSRFVGRDFLFTKLDAFLASHDRGYFVLQGEPGIGKTAIAARLVKTRRYPYHFNDVLQGIVRPEQFLENIGAQLVTRLTNGRDNTSKGHFRDAGDLTSLLDDVSQRLLPLERLVIVVDALDEAERPASTRANPLFLPPRLPKAIYFFLTTRPVADLSLHAEAPLQTFHLDANSLENLSDVRRYVEETTTGHQVLSQQIRAAGISLQEFADLMVAKSDGNFVYLHHVLRDLEAGTHTAVGLQALPQGLKSYYENHWQKMRGRDQARWSRYLQPVICVLAAAREPVSLKQIAHFAGLAATDVAWVITEWREFLREAPVADERRFRIYHSSFQDFLRRKDEVGEINLKQTHLQIGDALLRILDT